MSAAAKRRVLDFSNFPAASITEYTTLVCIACIFKLFTKQLGMAPRTAYSEIKKYAPTLQELTAPQAVRPFFDSDESSPRCPYCNAVKRWHARLDTYRIEGGKTTDALRRALVKTLPVKNDQFQLIEKKSDRRSVFFDWLDTQRLKLDLEDDAWLVAATRAFLERQEPKTDWEETFAGLRAIRRSARLETGWERDGTRLFLAPPLYGETLLVQYLVSRSHRHGGRTSEGRLTLPELIRRLRFNGFLSQQELAGRDNFEILERLVDDLAGSGALKLHYIVDRRQFLDKVKSVYAHYAN